jgi:hypothetical protein
MSEGGDANNNSGDVADTDKSFFTNLKNKITYKLQSIAYDPKADEYAQKKEEKSAEEKAKKKPEVGEKDVDDTTDKELTPNEQAAQAYENTKGVVSGLNFRRLASTTYGEFMRTVKKYIWPFIALMLAMIVANEMIVYSVPIRIIFFIFTIWMVLTNELVSMLLPIFYVLKGAYSYFTNNMTDGPKQRIMPTIYALLPITTYKPTSKIGSFLIYPFNYPKTESGAIELPEITKDYWKKLVESFKDFNAVKDLPIFVKDIKKAQEGLTRLHDSTGTFIDFSLGKNKESKNGSMEQPAPAPAPAPVPTTNSEKS